MEVRISSPSDTTSGASAPSLNVSVLAETIRGSLDVWREIGSLKGHCHRYDHDISTHSVTSFDPEQSPSNPVQFEREGIVKLSFIDNHGLTGCIVVHVDTALTARYDPVVDIRVEVIHSTCNRIQTHSCYTHGMISC